MHLQRAPSEIPVQKIGFRQPTTKSEKRNHTSVTIDLIHSVTMASLCVLFLELLFQVSPELNEVSNPLRQWERQIFYSNGKSQGNFCNSLTL